MIIPSEYEKYKQTPSDCPIYDRENPDYRCGVDYDKTNYRKIKLLKSIMKKKKLISLIFAN